MLGWNSLDSLIALFGQVEIPGINCISGLFIQCPTQAIPISNFPANIDSQPTARIRFSPISFHSIDSPDMLISLSQISTIAGSLGIIQRLLIGFSRFGDQILMGIERATLRGDGCLDGEDDGDGGVER